VMAVTLVSRHPTLVHQETFNVVGPSVVIVGSAWPPGGAGRVIVVTLVLRHPTLVHALTVNTYLEYGVRAET